MYVHKKKETKMKKEKNVRTKTKKTERIEIRCTKAFKEKIKEMSVQNNETISETIERICTDKMIESMKTLSVQKEPPIDLVPTGKKSTQEDRDNQIWRMLREGLTPTQTAEWLNQNGYKPQRGDKFTMNSVHSIRKRLKRERENS